MSTGTSNVQDGEKESTVPNTGVKNSTIKTKTPARMVGGMRRSAAKVVKKTKSALSLLTELLNDREYQMSKEIPDLTSVEFLSNTENHKKIENPTMRISSKLQLMLIVGKLSDMSMSEKDNLVMPVFPQSGDEDNHKKDESRFQRRFKPILNKQLKDFTLNELKDVAICRTIIQSSSHVVKDAKVFQIDNGKVFLVWGDLIMSGLPRPSKSSAIEDNEDDDIPDLAEADKQLSSYDNTSSTSLLEKTDDHNEDDQDDGAIQIPDGMTFTQNDVELVCENGGCSRSDAIQELIYNKGDLINTIMAFTPESDGYSPAQLRAEMRRKGTQGL